MGLCLATFLPLAMSLETFGGYLSGGLQAALGLGLVIFVHELGHFAVAKWCGVQCDKFMIGFDIGGYKIGRKWGETYYGIGILPLGGYVKMMGQDDDPSKVAEQLEQSKATAGDENAKEIIGPNGETMLVDRRSYMAKSVPQRMAIISAGVIMNVIFAFVFAFIAYGIGVPKAPAVANSTSPGGVAWQANLRTGDRITRVDDVEDPTFEAFWNAVTLGDLQKGISVDVTRADGEQISDLRLVPKKVGSLPQVGLAPSATLRVPKGAKPARHSPASEAENTFEGGDLITAINGVPVANFAEFVAEQLPQKNVPITYTVARGGDAEGAGAETAEITVAPNPRERLGIVPVLGPIAAVQKDSPAEAAGLQVGDQLLSINGVYLGAAPNGEATWDPVTIDDRLAEIAAVGETAIVSVQRGEGEPLDVSLTPRIVTWDERPTMLAPVSIPALGVACPMTAEVAAIVDGSPAQSADLQPGDKIVSGQLLLEGKPLTNEEGSPYLKKPLEFGDEKLNWPTFLGLLQDQPAETVAQLVVNRGGTEHTVEVGIAALPGAYAYARGIRLTSLQEVRSAGSLGEQTAMAWNATYRSLTQVVRFLSKIGTQVPVGALGGPLTILNAGYSSANDGVGTLLLFLTMLSANLAVLNFLPIPVLDGGHMVFLAYEGLRGRPANERVVMAMQMCGMAFLLSLMIFVFGLDLGLIDRGL